MNSNNIFPIIVCIAKNEYNYIEEFVKYHLALGFKHIYLYDNQDVPDTYLKILDKYLDFLTIIHLPGNDYDIGIQMFSLNHFISNIVSQNNNITHVVHIDIDEYIVLKIHSNITDFIIEYIKDDCYAIGINWKMFGSSGHTKYSSEPITSRFTKCDKNGNIHIKTLCDIKMINGFNEPHSVNLKQGYTKSTNGDIITGPFNDNPCYDVIQINHYKLKTLEEYKTIRLRGRADIIKKDQLEYNLNNVIEEFKNYDFNDIEDLTAKTFYSNIS